MSKPNTIAFIVGTKNEQALVKYVSERFEKFAQFSIVVTDSDGKPFENFKKVGLIVDSVASLEKKGDVEIANRAARGQLSAIFIYNPASIAKQFPADRLAAVVEKAWQSDTHICVSRANADLTLNQLIALQGLQGKQKKGAKDNALQQVILNIFPTFDTELDANEKAKRDKVSLWAQQQLIFWLDSNGLGFLRPLINSEEKSATEETKYFKFDDDISNFVKLKCAPLETSFNYLTLGPAASLRDIWDHRLFERDFLISHHLFTTSTILLEHLKKAYNAPPPPGSDPDDEDMKPAKTVLTILKDWILMEYGSDFSENPELEFLNVDIAKNQPEVAKTLLDMLEAALSLSPPYPVDLTKAPKLMKPKELERSNTYTGIGLPGKSGSGSSAGSTGNYVLHFYVYNPVEVARQMTLMDETLFHKVKAKEFLGGAWTKKDAQVKAPNLTNFIKHTNKMAAWIVTEILKQKTQEAITAVITRFIRIGKELLELRNYNGVMNILTALHSGAISRLKNSWAAVNSKDVKDFETLTESLSLLGHYKNYRETLKTLPASTPCIPLIAVTCSDLNGLGEVLENITSEGHINWEKHSKVAHHIWSVKRFMRARFVYHTLPELQTYLRKAPIWEGEKTLSAIAKLRDTFSAPPKVGSGASNSGSTVSSGASQNSSSSSGSALPSLNSSDLKSEKADSKADSPVKKAKASNKEKNDKGQPGGMKLSEKEWSLLDGGARHLTFKKGAVILPDGIVNRHLYRVVKGTVRVEKAEEQEENAQPKVVVLNRLKEREMFGEFNLLSFSSSFSSQNQSTETGSESASHDASSAGNSSENASASHPPAVPTLTRTPTIKELTPTNPNPNVVVPPTNSIVQTAGNPDAMTTACYVADSDGVEIWQYDLSYVIVRCHAEPLLSFKINKIIALKLADRLRRFAAPKVPAKKNLTKLFVAAGDATEEAKKLKKTLSEKQEDPTPAAPHDPATLHHVETHKDIGAPPTDLPPPPPGVHVPSNIRTERSQSVMLSPAKETAPNPAVQNLQKQAQRHSLAIASSSSSGSSPSLGSSLSKKTKKKDKDLVNTDDVIKSYKCYMKVSSSSSWSAGSLYICTTGLIFTSSVFGRKTKEVIPMFQVMRIEYLKAKDCIEIDTNITNKTKYLFKDFTKDSDGGSTPSTSASMIEAAAELILSVSYIPSGPQSSNLSSATSAPSVPGTASPVARTMSIAVHKRSGSTNSIEEEGQDDSDDSSSSSATTSSSPSTTTSPASTSLLSLLTMTDKDWDLILEGCRVISYQKDEVVIQQNQAKNMRLFQIETGVCRIEKEIIQEKKEGGGPDVTTGEKKTLKLGEISPHDGIFGEISFLEGSSASASVIAHEDGTTIHVIEGFFLDVVFEYYPGMSGRFYHYLAQTLSSRLKKREQQARNQPADDSSSSSSSSSSSAPSSSPSPSDPSPSPAEALHAPIIGVGTGGVGEGEGGGHDDDHDHSTTTELEEDHDIQVHVEDGDGEGEGAGEGDAEDDEDDPDDEDDDVTVVVTDADHEEGGDASEDHSEDKSEDYAEDDDENDDEEDEHNEGTEVSSSSAQPAETTQ